MDSCKQIISLSLNDLVGKIASREISVTDAVDACLKRIDCVEPKISAFLSVNAENSLKLAREMDQHGPDSSKPLWGVPVAVKDALSTAGMLTTAASRILKNFIPVYDAFVIKRLREAGAIIIGKTNMDEFAMGSSTENSAFKKTCNPWNPARVPGGSSGGSAAAVSAGECFAALGSDTGGSIRQPASFCGCVGLKPTYGRVSRYGLFAFASSLDQIGPMARKVEDCALMLNVIAGYDARDNTSSTLKVDDYLPNKVDKNSSKPFSGMNIGYPESFFHEGLDQDTAYCCNQVIDLFEKLGANLVKIGLPDSDLAIASYYIIAMAEASSNLARYDGVRYGIRSEDATDLPDLYVRSRSEGFGEEVKRRIMLGSYILSSGYYDAYFKKAAQIRHLIYDQYLNALDACDAMVMPVSPVVAWELGTHEKDPLKSYLMDAFTTPVSLAGLPAISLPCGVGENTGMPVGIQLVCKHFEEKKLLQYAAILENSLPAINSPL